MDSPPEGIEKTDMGIKRKGKLEEIAEFSKKIKTALEKVDEEEEFIEEFDFWKPEKQDNEEDIKDRTAKAACLHGNKDENSDKDIKEDLSEAKKELQRAIKEFYHSDQKENGGYSEKKILEAYKKLFEPIASESVKFISHLEEIIYSKFMLNFNPYYFDAKKFSVCLKRDGDEFEIDFNSPEKEYRSALEERFRDEE